LQAALPRPPSNPLCSQPRRAFDRGPCFQAPALTDEDRDWDGRDDGGGSGDSDDFEGRAAARAAAARAATAAAGYDSDSDGGGDGGAKRKAKGQGAAAAAGKVKMTTSIRLLDPEALAKATAGAPEAGGGRKRKGGDGVGGDDERGGKRRAGDDGGGGGPLAEVPEALRGLPPLVQACMVSLGHAEATPVQAAAWAPACEGRDVLAVAEPGSGKTLGYLLPAFMRAVEGAAAAGAGGGGGPALPRALVLAPTRELALQVAGVARALRGATRATSAVVYGGVLREQQVRAAGALSAGLAQPFF
jgi:hypothetical protein